jgi:alginate O-acetyltransferase complex protein AlgI
MIYSAPEFLLLLLLTVVALQLADVRARKVILLLASYVFVIWAGWITTILLVATAVVIYAAIRLSVAFPRSRAGLVAGTVVVLLVNLAVWKYWPWFARGLGMSDGVLARSLAANGIPVGISFYTFQGIAYVVDFNRGKAQVVSFADFLLFKSFFAQLIAGPIVRYDELMPQVVAPRHAQATDIIAGIELFALGMFKKLALADRAAALADPIFANPSGQSNGLILCAVLLYTVQIYGDFSGYTDMGRGAARMCGIVLPENFRAPYLSTSVRDFWRRWHMTLGRWLRDYVYISLGGSRHGFARGLGALFVTMALCGLWHGAAWTFVLWGIYHGTIMIIERVSIDRFGFSLPPWLSMPLTLAMVMVGWIIFRVENFSDIGVMLHAIAAIPVTSLHVDPRFAVTTIIIFAVAMLIQLVETRSDRVLWFYQAQAPAIRGAAIACLLLAAVALRGQEIPFIYFEF